MAGKYFSIHHRFLAWVGRLTRTIILCPHPVSIGNASEDYLFGLLKARREGKKLVVLYPFQILNRLKIRVFDPAILYLESDLLATKYRSVISLFLSGIFTLYFIITNALKCFLYKCFRIKLSGYYWRPLAGQDILWRPDAGQIKFDWTLSIDQDWETQFSPPLELSLPKKHVVACEAKRERMGLPRDAWFVCLHVREGGYKGDLENNRNCDIGNYIGGIKEITQRGGWVVRMGDTTMTKLPVLERVIDYPFTPSRSAIMDVYLLKECSFYIGTSTGILDTALLLGKPVVATNMTHWINLMPLRYGDLAIFKHVFSRSENRFISVQEWLQRASMITMDGWSSPDWHLFENSEEEITSVIKEMLDSYSNKDPTPLQQEFRKAHLCAAQELSENFRFDLSEVENCNEWFRFASRMIAWRGEISTEFLEKNWLKGSRNNI
ncbi:TIGR04372 family glycosyltransferase [Candidatus Pacearchaeota archaeon]|nr:TIGR04372 family glycosyltransferase [Candidatus Pacearchaeota archaeon]